LKSVIATCYISGVAGIRRPVGFPADRPFARGLEEDTAMAIEIFYLTTQIQRWINERVARHLAAQAAKLTD
jgi:hypothetical protein